ncbi:MAG: hypothetical protein AAGA60_30995 [Cyanobacteria bacterium P01_E01_bin.42]
MSKIRNIKPGLTREQVEALFQSALANERERIKQEIIEELNLEISLASQPPIGSILLGFWVVPPINYLPMNGQVLPKINFPEFWEWADNWERDDGKTWRDLIGLTSDSVTLPDSIDDFLRICSTKNPLTQKKRDSFQSHYHKFRKRNAAPGGAVANPSNSINNPNAFLTLSDVVVEAISDGVNGEPRTSDETQPKQTSVNGAFKVKMF